MSAQRPTPAQLIALKAVESGACFAWRDGMPCSPPPSAKTRWDVLRRLKDRGLIENGERVVDSTLCRLQLTDDGRAALDAARGTRA